MSDAAVDQEPRTVEEWKAAYFRMMGMRDDLTARLASAEARHGAAEDIVAGLRHDLARAQQMAILPDEYDSEMTILRDRARTLTAAVEQAHDALRKIERLQSHCECWDISRTALTSAAGGPDDSLA